MRLTLDIVATQPATVHAKLATLTSIVTPLATFTEFVDRPCCFFGGAKFFPSTVKIHQVLHLVRARLCKCVLACAQLFGGPARRAWLPRCFDWQWRSARLRSARPRSVPGIRTRRVTRMRAVTATTSIIITATHATALTETI